MCHVVAVVVVVVEVCFLDKNQLEGFSNHDLIDFRKFSHFCKKIRKQPLSAIFEVKITLLSRVWSYCID